MNKTVFITSALVLLIGGVVIYSFRAASGSSSSTSTSTENLAATPAKTLPTNMEAQATTAGVTKADGRSAATIDSEQEGLGTPPKAGTLSVWTQDGSLNDEVIGRYRLTPDQIARLNELKAELLKRMQTLDVKNATVQMSEDRRTLSITIKADPEAAKSFTDYYHRTLENILGADDYADLEKYHYTVSTDELVNAGLLDKKIDIRKLVVTGDEPQYHIRAESRMKVTPEGMPPSWDTRVREATGDRKEIELTYSVAPLILPKDF